MKSDSACIRTVEGGQMTKDLALAAGVEDFLTTEQYLDAVATTLEAG